ncbi:putative glutamate receptor 2 [Apostichopus japonicus]|uniref:Putative glutamate receptor 2 n=1 Tax=Stichopus japonicus TaxID=307972 RepID=A0A2G8KLV2_STIJA|nr:putative glutamate receptor 2 [Apostichopus japonicus]
MFRKLSVSLYGHGTAEEDLYKQIMTDATTFINDAGGRGILPPNDQINVIHEKVLEDNIYEEQNLFKSVFQICNDIRSMEALALIMPSDFCDNCEAIGRAIGDAYSPVITLDQADNSGAFQMRPRLADIDSMITSVIDHFKWRTFIMLYEGKVALKLVESMMAKAVLYGWRITPLELKGDYEAQTDEIRERKVKNILVYVSNEDKLKKIVKESFDNEIMGNGWHWMFGNLNPPITEAFLEQKYRHNMAFLTRFKMESNELMYHSTIEEAIKKWPFRQRAAYDALVAVAHAMKGYYDAHGSYPDPVRMCGGPARSKLVPYMKTVNFRGASGDVSFNDQGERVNYTIIMYSGKDQSAETKAGFFVQDIRSWEQANNEKWPGKKGNRMFIEPFRQSDARFIKVLAVPEPPFFMQKNWESIRYKVDDDDDIDYDEHEDKYSGMSWELLKKVKEVMEEEMGVEFNYEIELKSRGQYGSLDLSNNEWDGMVRDLMDGDADVAIGALVRDPYREEVVDFTDAWYEGNVKLLILHPSWTFEYPFSMVYPIDVWGWFVLLLIFILASLLVFFLGMFSPYEWRKLAERGEASAEDGQIFNFLNSFFYTLSTGFWQGYYKGPRSWSLRIFSIFWFWALVCTLFIYVFSLNGVMKFSKTAINIHDHYDLLHQDQFKFGLVRFSPAYDFYRYNVGKYRMVFDRVLNSDEKLIEERIENAVYRIRRTWEGRFSLLGEDQILKYAAERKPCRMYIAGKSLGNITFGFATQSGSPLRDQLSHAIQILEKNGELQKIREMKFSDELKCERETIWEGQSKYSFTVHDLQGMYYLIFIGMGGSFIVFVLEWLIYNIFIVSSWKSRMPQRMPARKKDDFLDGGDLPIDGNAAKSSADWI